MVERQIKYLSPSQVEKLLKYPKSIRDRAILAMAVDYGLRASEVGLIRVKDVNIQDGKVFIGRLKGGISNLFTMQPSTFKLVKSWIKIRGTQDGPLFLSRQNKAIGRRRLDVMFKRYAEMVGIPPDKRHFHVLRHSCAVDMVEKDIPMRRIQDWLGHRDPKSTMVYADVSQNLRDDTADVKFGLKTEQRVKVDWKKDRK